jgi:hypothetical protein
MVTAMPFVMMAIMDTAVPVFFCLMLCAAGVLLPRRWVVELMVQST